MANQLFAGTLANFNGSMAQSIENAMASLIGPLPSAPPQAVIDRRVLFIAIARGVIDHLQANQAAFAISFTTLHEGAGVNTFPTIGVKVI